MDWYPDTLINSGMDTCGVFTDSVTLSAPPIVEACGVDTLYNNAAVTMPWDRMIFTGL